MQRDMQSGDMAQIVAQTMCTFMSKFMGQQSMPSPSQAECPTLTVLTQSPPRAALPASGASSSEALIPLSASGAPPPAPIALIPLPASGAQLPASAFETPQRRLRLFQSPEPKMGRIAAARPSVDSCEGDIFKALLERDSERAKAATIAKKPAALAS